MLAGCENLESKFRRADVDHDGKLSPVEFSDGVSRLAFKRYDTNNDGCIEIAEWRVVDGNGADKQFKLRDLNHDGKISVIEAEKVARQNGSFTKLFVIVDTNKDGSIEFIEAKTYRKAHPAKKP